MTLADAIADAIRAKQTFHVADVHRSVSGGNPVSPQVFGLAFHRALEILRADGIEFAPVRGAPGERQRVGGVRLLKRAGRFHKGAIRKLARANRQLDNIDPADLDDREMASLFRAQERAGRLLTMTHLASEQGQTTTQLLSRMEPKP